MSDISEAAPDLAAGRLRVVISRNRQELGSAAARQVGAEIRRLLAGREEISILFASAPSQNETLAALAAEPDIPWKRVTAFHLDEYLGLPETHPASFRRYLHDRLFAARAVKRFVGIGGESKEPEREIARY